MTLLAASLLLSTPGSTEDLGIRGGTMSVDVAADGRIVADLRRGLWVIPAGGGDAERVGDALSGVSRPRWSPDAAKLTFRARHNGEQGLWLYDLASAQISSLGEQSRYGLFPAWHPGGERIVYAAGSGSNGLDLWETDIATGLHWRISDREGDESQAAWSANGRDLVYVHQRAGRWSLMLRRFGQPEEVLATSEFPMTSPSWRPDGSLITWVTQSPAERRTLTMAILSVPRLIRDYELNGSIGRDGVRWLDRQRFVYQAENGVHRRNFDAWRSRPVHFRAAIPAQTQLPDTRERPQFPWPDEPSGQFIVHAARLFDGVSPGYRFDKDIHIDGGRIVAVEDHDGHSGGIVIDLGDVTVIPGLIDPDARLPGDLRASHGPDLLTTGVTTIVATHPQAATLREHWSGKDVPGPRWLSGPEWTTGELPDPQLDVTAAVSGSRTTGQVTGRALRAQFRTLAFAGLGAEQMLRAVGVNAAAALLADPYIGRIAPAAAADLVFVGGDPLNDVRDALNVVAVVRNGRFFSVSGLIDRAKAAEAVE